MENKESNLVSVQSVINQVKVSCSHTGSTEKEMRALVQLQTQNQVSDLEAIPTVVGIRAAQSMCHGLAVRSGWWADPATGEWKDRNDGEMIALMHSELSEALEGLRKNLMDDHLPHRKQVEMELADTLIRIFDYAGARGLDLGGAVIEKLAYNQRRADHKLENRAKDDGKKF